MPAQRRPSQRRTRNVLFALFGALVLVLKNHYGRPLEGVVHSYAGNTFVSLSLYFAALSGVASLPRPRLWAAGLTLAAVTAFEVTNGFGVMVNVYDEVDLAANAIGVALALALDLATDRRQRRSAPGEGA